VHTFHGIEFQIQISGVSLHRGKEEFQTAVLTGDTQRAGFFGTDLGFSGGEPDVKGLIVVAHLSRGGNIHGRRPFHLIHRGNGNGVPVKNIGFRYNMIGSHKHLLHKAVAFRESGLSVSFFSPERKRAEKGLGRENIFIAILPVLW
jgi:hypothetical protein